MSILSKRLNKHFAVCAAAAAGAVALTGTQQADAAIVWSGAVNINIPSTTAGVYANLATGVNGITPASAPGWDINAWSSSALNFFVGGMVSGQRTDYVRGASTSSTATLAFATMIDGSSLLTTGTGTINTTGTTLNSSNNLFGFRFYHEGAGAFRFGWLRISLGATIGGQPRSIVEYAYEDTGAGIGAGVVPAPGTLAALALGAVGVRSRRRK